MPHYFIYENCGPVRVSDDGMDAVAIARDGTETPIDAYKVCNEGREVSEADALSWWRERAP